MLSPLVRKLENFGRLTKAERETLRAATATAHSEEPGSIIIREGERARGAPVILKGVACRYKLLPSGARQILDFLLPGDLCDGYLFAPHQMDHNIATLSECVVADIDLQALSAMAAGQGPIARALWWAALVDNSVAREWIANVGRRSAEQRVAHLLAELFLRLRAVRRAKANGFELPISQIDLADATALSTIHVNRVLSKLRAKQVLTVARRVIRVINARKLVAIADLNPAYLHLRSNGRR